MLLKFSTVNPTLIGRIGNVEYRFTSNNKELCTFSMACNLPIKDQDNKWDYSTMWFKVTVWEPTQKEKDVLIKGKSIAVDGELFQEKYISKDGQEKFNWCIKPYWISGRGEMPNDKANVSEQDNNANSGGGEGVSNKDDSLPFIPNKF